MKNKSLIASASALLMLVASCSTPKNVTYFQDLTSDVTVVPAKNLDIRVQPEDKLTIIVTTQDQMLSNLFNLVTPQNRLGQTTSSTTTIGSTSTYSEGRVSYYTVNEKGDITFPVIGEIHIAGMTRSEVAKYIQDKLVADNLVKDPVVTVEFANTGISIIGEVTKPGRYEFNKDHLNIIDALAMAGDLTTLGQRENVIVMRGKGENYEVYRIDLTNMESVANSPVFFLQQNDVIYVEPNDKKKRDTTASGNSAYNPSFWVSIGSLTVTLATFIVTLGK